LSGHYERVSSKILDAASDPLRLKVLKLLYSHGPLSYSDIMISLKLHPNRDAGKFAYHLRKLRRSDLIEVDKTSKKYDLTFIGEEVVSFSRNLDEYTKKKRERLLVRTSRLTLEEFDRSKIAKSLIKEANLPASLAQKLVSEVEDRLLKLGSSYLTAPLIREFVNAVLIEKGLKEYRDKLTRLGLPVYDIYNLITTAGKRFLNVEVIRNLTSDRIITEYALINILPHDVSLAHLSGYIHINNLGNWILKPCEIQHDIRVFLKDGYQNIQRAPLSTALKPPKTLQTALSLIQTVVSATSREVTGEQTLSYFNTFLAPFVSNLSFEDVRNILRLFIFNLNNIPSSNIHPIKIAISIDLSIPEHLKKIKITKKDAKEYYGDFAEKATKISKALLEVMFEDDICKPVFNPRLIINLRKEAFSKNDTKPILLKIHELSALRGIPYFANLTTEDQSTSTYFTSGNKLSSNWSMDWNLDTLRTGSLDSVILNLPRLAYEATGNDNKFFELLDQYIAVATRALKLKQKIIEDRISQRLLPLLSHKVLNDSYFRQTTASQLIGVIGLNEAVEFHRKAKINRSMEALKFARDIIAHTNDVVEDLSKDSDQRIAVTRTPNREASNRLAELDVNRYGWSSIRAKGTKKKPHYTDVNTIFLEKERTINEQLRIEGSLHKLIIGGHIALIDLKNVETTAESLLKMSKSICQSTDLGFFLYKRQISYCMNCKQVFTDNPVKCPKCESVDSLVKYKDGLAKYSPRK
jgi:anaerobic ribonucleoside-triphosphate reductase